MPTNVADHRHRNIEQQFAFVESQISDIDIPVDSDIIDRLISSIDGTLDQAEHRKLDYLNLVDQDGSEQLQRSFYQHYVTQLDFAEQFLERLQQTHTYTDIHHQQRGEGFQDRLEYTSAVCAELEDVFRFDIDIIPVIWDGYALLTILEADLYVLWLPRDEKRIPNAPFIAHEFGHAALEQIDKTPPQPFRDHLADFADGFADEQKDAVVYTWNQWFDELFCDAVGFFTFGPAYLLSAIYRLQKDDPYEFPDQIGPHTEFHPPDALRFTYLDELAAVYLPDELYARTAADRDTYRAHLDRLADEEPLYYEDWISDELLSLTTDTAREQGTDLERLVTYLTDDESTDPPPGLELRAACNDLWLDDR